jgi:hypothetical protein
MRTESSKLLARECSQSQEQYAWFDVGVSLVERLGVYVDSALTRQPWISTFILSLAFLAGASVKARQRTFWYDEILTEYVASLPSFDAIWKTLAAHAESSPPLFHLITKLSGATLGSTSLGLRFPAMAGYLTMMLCIYFIVRRYTGPLYALIAALSSYLTKAPSYATQARPYGLVLGLSCLALLCWHLVSRHRTRKLALLGLCLSLATAFSVHYYAALSLAAVGFGELVRTWHTRRIDWPVWGALGLATAPLPFLLPLMRSNWVLREGYFGTATLSHFLEGTTDIYLPLGGVTWLSFALLAGACAFVFSQRQSQPATDTFEVPPVHELAAWLALLLAPVEAFVAGRLVTGIFVVRYAIVTFIGFSILLSLCLHRLFRGSRAAAIAVLLFLILCFGGGSVYRSQIKDPSSSLTPWLQTSAVSRLPIVIGNPMTYLPLARYAGKNLADRVVYIADPKQALRYTGVTSFDYNLAGLRGQAPLNLPTYREFTDSHQQFLVLWEASSSDWITPKLLDTGVELRVCKTLGPRMLFLADLSERARSVGDGRPNLAADVACGE